METITRAFYRMYVGWGTLLSMESVFRDGNLWGVMVYYSMQGNTLIDQICSWCHEGLNAVTNQLSKQCKCLNKPVDKELSCKKEQW